MVEIHVCVKESVDVSSLEHDPKTMTPILEKAQRKVGDFEMNALEEAVRIKEKHGGVVKIFSAGPVVQTITMREALAIGADEAYVVSSPELSNSDPWVLANVLAALSRKAGKADLILCGEASVDESNYQIGPRIGEELGIPALTHVSKLELQGSKAIAHRSLEDRVEVVEVQLPAVVTVGLEINTPRLPSLLMIRASAKKPIHQVQLQELGLPKEKLTPRVRTTSVRVMKTERKRLVLEGRLDEVAEKLIAGLKGDGVLR
ncbi:MAG: electron transfer flavoprotein subunit beta/FixA family protein [Aigarchaeota archaeon]|nr:electron transfer flavoprotein subunit beta/FixA family protein [Aigarchaeota archaeon]MCS7118382.1 electron transfer flavoprotein subunit beta/FixA family protein [Candidatus Calditenuaceae archaeon]MDW8042576.1 electron transfer flavoprotein subunit beta/FixA family protein [Nitrososphaerota archaeon]